MPNADRPASDGDERASFYSSRFAAAVAAGAIVLAGLAAYTGSFSAPFVLDDEPAILANSTLRNLGHPWTVLRPPSDTTVSGRPVLNLSFALNYAVGGVNVWGYHAANVGIHLFSALILFGIVRRTLGRTSGPAEPSRRADQDERAYLIALASAALWTVHPLDTESVTYVVQRAESLMGLFYLLTLFSFIRAIDAKRPRRWYVASAAACLLGMATKEVMASAPLIVILYDRTFVAGSFREAWRKRRGYYCGLAATWLLLGYLVVSTHGRGNTVGPGAGIAWGPYLLVQIRAISHYLRLAFWPAPLIFDYGPATVPRMTELLPAACVAATLLAATALFVLRRSPLGFLGAFFFAVLAPTSLVPGVRQMMAEQRMYLPLAAVITAAVAGGYALGGRRSAALGVAAIAGLALMTARRNEAYRSQLSLWTDTVEKRPENPFARNNLANVLLEEGKVEPARAQLEEALRLKPDYSDAHNNLGNAFMQLGRVDDAMAHYEAALRLRPINATLVHNNLGAAYFQKGDMSRSAEQFLAAVRADPHYPEARNNLANLLLTLNRPSEALAEAQEAVRLKPDYAVAHETLGRALLAVGRTREAQAEFEAAAGTHHGAGVP